MELFNRLQAGRMRGRGLLWVECFFDLQSGIIAVGRVCLVGVYHFGSVSSVFPLWPSISFLHR